MTPSLKAKSLKPHEAYSRIFERIYIPEDDQYLIEWWQLLCSLTPSNFLEVEEQVKHNLIPMLKTEVEFSEDPIICLFLAHWYNFGYLSGVKNYQVIVEQSTLDAIKGFKNQFNDYSDQLNQYNLAISNWYYGLFNYYDSESDRSSYRLSMLEALRIIDDLLEEYTGIRPHDKFYYNLQEIHRELMLWSERHRPTEERSAGSPPGGLESWLKRLTPKEVPSKDVQERQEFSEAIRIINNILEEYKEIKPPADYYNDLQEIWVTIKPRYEQTSPKLKVFLCYGKEDAPKVRELYEVLKEHGFLPWLDEVDIMPGQDWDTVIKHSVRNSDIVLVCLSRKSVKKTGYVHKEIKYALDIADTKPESAVFIIPARLEECNIPERLQSKQWVDLFKKRGLSLLVEILREISRSK